MSSPISGNLITSDVFHPHPPQSFSAPRSNELLHPRHHRPVLQQCTRMQPCGHPIPREVRLDPGHSLLNRRRQIPPIPHQVAEDGEQSHEVHACSLHARIGSIAVERSGGGAGFDVGEDRVPRGILSVFVSTIGVKGGGVSWNIPFFTEG